MTMTTPGPRRASRRAGITGSGIRELQAQGPQPSRAETAVAQVLAQLQAIGLKPADLSTMLNADIRTIYRWEKGQGLGRLVHIQRLRDLEINKACLTPQSTQGTVHYREFVNSCLSAFLAL